MRRNSQKGIYVILELTVSVPSPPYLFFIFTSLSTGQTLPTATSRQ